MEVMGNTGDKRVTRRQQVVMRLFDALLDNDRDRVISFFAEDSIFESAQSGQPLTGGQAIWSALNTHGAELLERELLQLSAADDLVVAERTERYLRDGRWIERRLRSALTVDGCKIRAWREQQN